MSAPEFQVERSITINAPAAAIYPLIVNFREWQSWSPQETMDPKLHRQYGGPQSGVGSSYAWQGNRQAGQAYLEITEVDEPHEIKLNVDFARPMKAKNKTVFSLTESGDTTTVRWSMQGRQFWLIRLFGYVVNMDKLVGKDFEKGLASLREVAERP